MASHPASGSLAGWQRLLPASSQLQRGATAGILGTVMAAWHAVT